MLALATSNTQSVTTALRVPACGYRTARGSAAGSVGSLMCQTSTSRSSTCAAASFEPSGDAPESGLDIFPDVERLAPNLQRQRARRVACHGVTKAFALLRSLLAHRRDHDHEPKLFGVRDFGDGNVSAHTFVDHMRRYGFNSVSDFNSLFYTVVTLKHRSLPLLSFLFIKC